MTFGGGNEQEFIGKLTQITLEHLADEHFGGNELALAMGMSWSTLNRKLQSINGQHISQFIRETRLKKALELLQENNATASEVAFKVGFGSPAYFSKCFTQCFGFPPGEVKKRMAEGTLPLPGEGLHNENLCPKENSIFSWCSERGKPYLMAGFVALAVIFFSIAIILIGRKNKMTVHQGTHEKSIAVLPFKNLSSDPNNQYFADGITEDILNHLSRIGDLRVVSRTTAERFRDSELPSVEIAKGMGVNYLLEGSVRKQSENVRITVQLIDGKRDRHLWSENYDRQLSDIFLIQSEIARNVAKELQAVINPAEKSLIEKAPTTNLDAYNLFLIGNNYYWRSYDEQDHAIAVSMYKRALELDPQFAMAYIRLAILLARMYWFHYDYNPEQVTQCKKAIDAAIRIDPDLPEIHLALGYYYYMGHLDFPKAIEQLEMADKKIRNNPEIYLMIGSVYRRKGDWNLALEHFLHAFELDPGSPQMAFNTAETLFLLGKYPQAEEYFKKTAELNPAYIYSYWMKSLMYLKQGYAAQARNTVEEALKFREADDNPQIIETIARLDIIDGQPLKAISFLKAREVEVFDDQFNFHVKSYYLAKAFGYAGMQDSARVYFEAARVDLEARLRENPEDSRLYSSLGKVYAGLGMKEKAIEFGKKGVEMMPIEKEAYRGVIRLEDLANIYVTAGSSQEAIPLLDQLLSLPGLLSANLLLMDPTWKPLWNLPEFKKLAEKYN